jgi:bis(5'-nucleosidyl)-tetraphosphatase
MMTQRTAGAVIFYGDTKSPQYLLLKHARKNLEPKEYWNFPKGHIERGETPREAAEREILEETGLHDLQFIRGFRETERYAYVQKGKRVSKSVVWFLARSKNKGITISSEHIGSAWLSYEKAYKKVFYPGTKVLLKKAHKFLAKIK